MGLDLHSASEDEEALDFTEEHEPGTMELGSEDDDTPIELKTWTGFIDRTSAAASNSPGSSREKPMVIPDDDSATGAGLYPCV